MQAVAHKSIKYIIAGTGTNVRRRRMEGALDTKINVWSGLTHDGLSFADKKPCQAILDVQVSPNGVKVTKVASKNVLRRPERLQRGKRGSQPRQTRSPVYEVVCGSDKTITERVTGA